MKNNIIQRKDTNEKVIIMAKKKTKTQTKKPELRHVCKHGGHEGVGAFYFLGFIGAVIYYLSTATGFWVGVLGVLKSIVWPVFLVHGLLKFLGL